MHSHIRSQQPGGLTDVANHRMRNKVSASRNWFDITWTTPALIANYQINDNTRWNTKLFATIGDRNSVGFLQSITVKTASIQLRVNTTTEVLNVDQIPQLWIGKPHHHRL